MNIIQEIFRDHYEVIIYTLHPRATEIENIDKMINCGDASFGGAMYGCPHCGHLKFVPFRCHSRFCPTCGNMYSRKRATTMAGKIINCQHRHCVFTIPEELRHYFLEWNPHIHCLVSEGGYSDDGFWRKLSHFNYTFLRNSFRTVLLNEMEHHIGPSFKREKAKMYKAHDKGFYVHAKPSLSNPNVVTEYIGRYLGRPVIATSRIDCYNKKDDTVTFHYNRHEDNVYVERTVPAIDFIQLLMQHIPEKNFKMVRYYGLYARHRDIDKKLHRARSPEKQRLMISFNHWRESILLSFGYDPLACPKCHKEMKILEIYYNHTRVPLEELYEKARLKARAAHWRSSA